MASYFKGIKALKSKNGKKKESKSAKEKPKSQSSAKSKSTKTKHNGEEEITLKKATPGKRQPSSSADGALVLHKVITDRAKKNVDPLATVFIQGVVSYVMYEIFELSFDKARARSTQDLCVITADDIKAAIENDEEMKHFMISGDHLVKALK